VSGLERVEGMYASLGGGDGAGKTYQSGQAPNMLAIQRPRMAEWEKNMHVFAGVEGGSSDSDPTMTDDDDQQSVQFPIVDVEQHGLQLHDDWPVSALGSDVVHGAGVQLAPPATVAPQAGTMLRMPPENPMTHVSYEEWLKNPD